MMILKFVLVRFIYILKKKSITIFNFSIYCAAVKQMEIIKLKEISK